MNTEQRLDSLIGIACALYDSGLINADKLAAARAETSAVAKDLLTVTNHRDELLTKLNSMGNITGKNLGDDIALAREFEQLAESCSTVPHKMAGWIDEIVEERDDALSARETIEEEFDANVAGYQINIANLEKWFAAARKENWQLKARIERDKDVNATQEKMIDQLITDLEISNKDVSDVVSALRNGWTPCYVCKFGDPTGTCPDDACSQDNRFKNFVLTLPK